MPHEPQMEPLGERRNDRRARGLVNEERKKERRQSDENQWEQRASRKSIGEKEGRGEMREKGLEERLAGGEGKRKQTETPAEDTRQKDELPLQNRKAHTKEKKGLGGVLPPVPSLLSLGPDC